jgi:hypothetical protein
LNVLQFHQSAHSPVEPDKVADLRQRVDTVFADLEETFPATMVARAFLVAGANRLIEVYGSLATVWSLSRVQDLMAGQWTSESQSSFIATYDRSEPK